VNSAEKIRTITSLTELEGYEAAAKQRGITPEELLAIHEARQRLTFKRRKRNDPHD